MDEADFRACLGKFATGVTIVGYGADGGARGITVNAFNSVSLNPPLVLISIAKAARSHDLLEDSPFSVNVLTVDQEDLALHFAGDPREVEVPWVEGTVAPRLDGVLAWMECEPYAGYDAGDHTLYLGRVVDVGDSEGDALGFFSSRFVNISRPIPSQPPLPYDPFELPYDA
jgi:flavin reductase (DIM6/NTAB) family NADH-FMN oxidoreductase RutF